MSGTVHAIVQARMSSLRMPGKVLLEVRGRPILDFLIQRLHLSHQLDGIVVATSTAPSDDIIADYCERHALPYVRGDLTNVSSRFVDVINQKELNSFLRVCADRPLLDSRLIDEAIHIFKNLETDIVSNAYNPTYPKGQTIEIINAELFVREVPKFTNDYQREHVFPYFYQNSECFRIYSLEATDGTYQDVNLCIDTQSDLERFDRILSTMKRPPESYGWLEITQIYRNLCS